MRETAIDIFSGGVAGMVRTAMGHPFDTLKEYGCYHRLKRIGKNELMKTFERQECSYIPENIKIL